jgi:hypothetical protein
MAYILFAQLYDDETAATALGRYWGYLATVRD